MNAHSQGWSAYIPFAIFAAVMLWRFRTMDKARPLRLPLLWLMPLIITAAVCLALYAMPPSGLGWLAVAGGIVIGGAVGSQRARLMRLHVEGEGDNARVMVRQSPLALLLILGVFAARRLLLPEMTAGNVHPGANALLVTDGMLGLVLGMVVSMRLVLWLRARTMAAHHIVDA